MNDDLARYHRQMLLPGFGESGQRRLQNSTVAILGCGALGSVAADMLARAGVGHLIIIDRDYLEITNLQRQVLFDEQDVADGIPKAVAAKRKLGRINSDIVVTAVVDDINHTNIARHTEGADVLVDGLDNFTTRYLANDLAVRDGVPYVYGAAVGTTGMAFPILPHTTGSSRWEKSGVSLATPCFRCLFEEAPPPGASPTCDTVGVLSSAVAIVANYQVAETLKILTGNYQQVSRTLLNLDLWTNDIHQLKVSNAREKGDCPCCKHRQFDYLEGKAGSSATSLCGRDAVQLRHWRPSAGVDLPTIAARLEGHGDIKVNEYMLRANVGSGAERFEISLFPDGRAIVKGTDDAAVARTLFAKYIGD